MTDQELHLLCVQYGQWGRSRKLLAPPIPQNVLARLQPCRRVGGEPDGPMDPLMPYFNMAVHALAEEDPSTGLCFALYFIHGFRPVKSMAAALGIGTRTVYDRINRHARRVHQLAHTIRRANELGAG